MARSKINITGDITNLCNSHCAICYLTYLKIRPQKALLSEENMATIFEKLAPYSGSLSLSCCFEPLVHPHADSLIRLTKQLNKQFMIRLNTNGIGLRESVAESIVFSELDRVVISLDSASANLNRIIRGNNKFEQILSNIKYFVNCRAQEKTKSPRIILRMVLHQLNLPELIPLVELSATLGADELYVQFMAPVDNAYIDGIAANELILNPADSKLHDHFEQARQRSRQLSLSLVLPPLPNRNVTSKTLWHEKKQPFAETNGFHFQSDGTCRVSVYNQDIYGNTVNKSCGNILRDTVDHILQLSHDLRHPTTH